MTYQEQLKDKRWISLRDSILQRDWNMCQHCMSCHNLHVHHKRYYKGKMAWEYSPYDLVTLCNKCHREEHGIQDPGEPDMNDPFVRLPYLILDYTKLLVHIATKELEQRVKEKEGANQNG